MSKRVSKIMRTLAQRDFLALKSIYDFRCLSFYQVYYMIYRISEKTGGVVTDEYAKKKFNTFKKAGLIEEDFPTKGESVFFLTPDGVKVVKEAFDLPDNIYDSSKRIHRKGFLTSTELRVAPRFIAHQYNLNQFVINTIEQFEGTPYRYEDEKHIKSLVGIRPDGIFSMYNIDFFLEMDMGTENVKQLKEKWDNYRRFIRSQEFICKERKIIVLFIVDGIAYIDQRINLIKKTILDQLDDLVSLDMEFYFNTPENLLKILKEKIVPQEKGVYIKENILKSLLQNKHGFSIARGESISKYLNDEKYMYFIFKKEKNVSIEFIVNPYFYDNMSAICQMLYFEAKRAGYLDKFKRNVSMLIVLDDITSFVKQVKDLDILIPSCCYFTTIDHLKEKTLDEAVFSLSSNGEQFFEELTHS